MECLIKRKFMANSIWYKEKPIFRANNSAFLMLYEALAEEMKKSKNENMQLSSFILSLDQEALGYGCVTGNIDRYLNNKEDYINFAVILNKAIQEICRKNNFADQDQWLLHFKAFHKNILNIIDAWEK